MSAKKAQPGAARTQSYRAAYQQLSRIAAELEGGETDLDKVLPLLTEAQAAYEVCKERIDALRTALELGAVGAPSAPMPEEFSGEDSGDGGSADEDDDDF